MWNGQALTRVGNQNPPCAVCEVSTRSKHLMIPGTYDCPNGWTTEYSGWLVSGAYGHKARTMYVCLDKYPDTVDGEGRSTNGALMYHVEVQCNRGIPVHLMMTGRNCLVLCVQSNKSYMNNSQ